MGFEIGDLVIVRSDAAVYVSMKGHLHLVVEKVVGYVRCRSVTEPDAHKYFPFLDTELIKVNNNKLLRILYGQD